MSFKILKEIKG